MRVPSDLFQLIILILILPSGHLAKLMMGNHGKSTCSNHLLSWIMASIFTVSIPYPHRFLMDVRGFGSRIHPLCQVPGDARPTAPSKPVLFVRFLWDSHRGAAWLSTNGTIMETDWVKIIWSYLGYIWIIFGAYVKCYT